MNEFFENAAETAADLVKEVGGAAKELAVYTLKKADRHQKVLRLQFAKAALKKLLLLQYREMGMLVYEMCKKDTYGADEITAKTMQIDETRRRICNIDKRMQEVLELIRCPKCGNVVKIKNAFCSSCGYKLAAEEEQTEENENEMNIPDMEDI